MKKIISLKKTALILTAAAFTLLVNPVYSQENGSETENQPSEETAEAEKPSEEENPAQTEEDSSEDSEETEIPEKTKEEIEAEKAARKAEKARIKAEKLAAKEKAREKQDEYLGITYKNEKKCTISRGLIRMDFKASTSSFGIYVKNQKKKYVSLLSEFEAGKSSAFFADVSGVVYRLNQNAAVTKTLRKISDNEVQLAYTIPEKAQIAVDFSTVCSKAESPADMVKVTVYVTNISDSENKLAVKAVFDTFLGEASDIHFQTAAGTKLSGEKKFDSMKNERAVISTDGKTSIQFVFDGETVTEPAVVSAGVIDSLLKGAWVPVITEGRNFNSINAYNNSALAVNWPESVFNAGETKSVTFYIASGVDGSAPDGIYFVDERAADYSEEIYPLPEVTEAQLDPVYVQDLINRINALKSDPETVNRQEVRELDAELDAILRKLRKQM